MTEDTRQAGAAVSEVTSTCVTREKLLRIADRLRESRYQNEADDFKMDALYDAAMRAIASAIEEEVRVTSP